MRFLHTSDWHLGKNLHGHDLSDAQQVALDAVIDTAINRRVDAFVIAGDVFDRAYPGVEDVRRLNRALSRIHDAGIPIICTAGNHDEGARLAAFMNLLDANVTVVGEYAQVGTVVELADEHGPVLFYPLPYLDPDGARRALAPEGGDLLDRSHEAVVAEAMSRVRADLQTRDPSTRAVVVSHAFVIRGDESSQAVADEQSESERDITVGGIPFVPSAVYTGVHYVALGHLHGPRTVQEAAPMVRYSGSLLRYSASETSHQKSVSIVDLDADGVCTVELVPVPQPAGMVRLHGDLAHVLSDEHAPHHDDFVEIVLTDAVLPDNYAAQLNHTYSRIMRVGRDRSAHLRAGFGDGGSDEDPTVTLTTPGETLRTFYARERGEPMSTAMQDILDGALERARVAVES